MGTTRLRLGLSITAIRRVFNLDVDADFLLTQGLDFITAQDGRPIQAEQGQFDTGEVEQVLFSALQTQDREFLTTESGDLLIAENFIAFVPGILLTQIEDRLITQDGDFIIENLPSRPIELQQGGLMLTQGDDLLIA